MLDLLLCSRCTRCLAEHGWSDATAPVSNLERFARGVAGPAVLVTLVLPWPGRDVRGSHPKTGLPRGAFMFGAARQAPTGPCPPPGAVSCALRIDSPPHTMWSPISPLTFQEKTRNEAFVTCDPGAQTPTALEPACGRAPERWLRWQGAMEWWLVPDANSTCRPVAARQHAGPAE